MFLTYWRGLDKDDAMVSFDVMMDLLPKVWIFVQFVPTLIFTFLLQKILFYPKKKYFFYTKIYFFALKTLKSKRQSLTHSISDEVTF